MNIWVKCLILLLFLEIVHAQEVNSMDANIYLSENDAKIEMFYVVSKINRFQFPLEGEIYDLNSKNASCSISSGVQRVIQCKIDSNQNSFSISFNVKDVVKQRENIMFFGYDIPISYNTKRVNVKLELPLGFALTDKVFTPVSPPNTEVGTDGRKIFIKWEFKNKEMDDIVPIRVYFEKVVSSGNTRDYSSIIVGFVSIIIILTVLYLRLIKRKQEVVLSVLNEAERTIVEILQNQPEEEVDQRNIVTLSGFSKAKVSRIIKSLEERGVVESRRYGKKNKIVLKKKFVKETSEQS
ncbi:MAG: hypothetical protein N3E38_02395 [Candidatus Aenigmarchaeota archaeon]|nr:hypothetical protein [Candidatus Aenigmarchaeota archaeon]